MVRTFIRNPGPQRTTAVNLVPRKKVNLLEVIKHWLPLLTRERTDGETAAAICRYEYRQLIIATQN